MKRFLIFKWLFPALLLLLAGCSPYHQTTMQVAFAEIKQLQPNYAAVKNGQIEYYQFGNGSPIILIPGYLTDISSWNKTFLAELAKHHQLIILNNRNVGGSVIQSTYYETSDLANDIYQLMHVLRLKKPVVLGISMGGMIAQQLAVLHPNHLRALILINTAIAGKKSIPPSNAIAKKILEMPLSKLGRYQLAIELFFPSSWRLQMAYALVTDRFQPKQYLEIDPATLKLSQRHLIMRWANDEVTAKKISSIKLPVLILNGEADAVIPPVNSVILTHTISNSRLFRWKEGGHAMIYQYPRQMAFLINQFIALK